VRFTLHRRYSSSTGTLLAAWILAGTAVVRQEPCCNAAMDGRDRRAAGGLRGIIRWNRNDSGMDSMKAAMIAATLLLAPTTPLGATDYSSEASVNATFECPEALKSDAERASSLRQFMSWIRGVHPDWPTPKIVGYRLFLLERYHCDQSLAKFRADPARID
jgi:hypothetical protein